MKLNDILSERFINLIGDDPRKEKYKNDVYDLLRRSYASIGGIKGNGFNNPSDMVENIPFWKLVLKNGELVAVAMYKDKNGRKRVALGTDGSDIGKAAIRDINSHENSRSYGELSKASLGLFLKSTDDPYEEIVPIDQVQKLVKDDIIPLSGKSIDDLPLEPEEKESTRFTLSRYPKLQQYAYLRQIQGKWLMKVMVGTPNLPIQK